MPEIDEELIRPLNSPEARSRASRDHLDLLGPVVLVRRAQLAVDQVVGPGLYPYVPKAEPVEVGVELPPGIGIEVRVPSEPPAGRRRARPPAAEGSFRSGSGSCGRDRRGRGSRLPRAGRRRCAPPRRPRPDSTRGRNGPRRNRRIPGLRRLQEIAQGETRTKVPVSPPGPPRCAGAMRPDRAPNRSRRPLRRGSRSSSRHHRRCRPPASPAPARARRKCLDDRGIGLYLQAPCLVGALHEIAVDHDSPSKLSGLARVYMEARDLERRNSVLDA